MALTLIEAAKQSNGDILRQAVIEMYARTSGVMRELPFENISGNALKYNREEKLPGIGFRGVNEGYPESTGILNPVTEPLVIAGGDLDVDKFILDTMGEGRRASEEMMKVKALALSWERTFFKGDMATEPREFDGLQKRVTGPQLIPAGTTAGGDPLSLLLLDELIDTVREPTHLFMSKAMKRRLTAAARSSDVGGSISWKIDEFGQRIDSYNGLPIVTVGNDNEDRTVLGFNEASPGGGSPESTSIYCVSFSDGGVIGLQNGVIEVRDLGELQEKPALRTRVEWYAGIAVLHGRAAARLWGIKNAPVVA